jgi:ribulose-phosphate 3-epimerase
MISDPGGFAGSFAAAGARRISFHPEVTDDPGQVIEAIRQAGAGAGIAEHPDVDTDVVAKYLDVIEVILMMTVRPGFGGQDFLEDVVPKINRARELAKQHAGAVAIEVDGGVNLETIDRAVRAGGEILVAGSAIFDGVDAPAAARRLRERLDALAEEVR